MSNLAATAALSVTNSAPPKMLGTSIKADITKDVEIKH